jgi:hypothetical protein
MRPSHATIDHQPKLIAEVWEAKHQEGEAALRQTEKVPTQATVLAISLDGVMAPVRQADGRKKEVSAGKQASGPWDIEKSVVVQWPYMTKQVNG